MAGRSSLLDLPSSLLAAAVGLAALTGCTIADPTNAGTDGTTGGGVLADGGRAACTTDAECNGGVCRDGACFGKSASDGKKNEGESDVDCGGTSAPPCADGKGCAAGTDCASSVCTGGVCHAPSATDGVKNGDESDVDCGGASTNAPRCADAKACAAAADCTSGVCANATCAAPKVDDGVKNGAETDIDCGGGVAAPCAADKACATALDCDSRFCTANLCEPRKTGRKDGDETDVDCGGKLGPGCAWMKTCLVDTDCAGNFCKAGTCEPPSCKAAYGGTTCGTGEVGDNGAQHESCCRSIEVPGYADPSQAGKKVYLDKYEITAGRMREFLARVAAEMGGQPNVKAYMAAHPPATRWKAGWGDILPTSNEGELFQYTVARPTVNRLYFGQDVFQPLSTQGTTWYVHAKAGNYSAQYAINTGVYTVLSGSHLFPEFFADVGTWTYPDYSASHNLNCYNGDGSYGYSTYHFPKNVLEQYSGAGSEKAFTQAEMDVKSLNCSPTGLFAAFCAWDGGQLATTEVFDTVTNNGSRLLVSGHVPTCADDHNVSSDGTGSCPSVYYYPFTDSDNDGSSRIAPPGRVAADAVTMPGAADDWHDLRGNLSEMLLKANDEFEWKGYGIGYGSAVHHVAQGLTPRFKEGSMGARCMRFR